MSSVQIYLLAVGPLLMFAAGLFAYAVAARQADRDTRPAE